MDYDSELGKLSKKNMAACNDARSNDFVLHVVVTSSARAHLSNVLCWTAKTFGHARIAARVRESDWVTHPDVHAETKRVLPLPRDIIEKILALATSNHIVVAVRLYRSDVVKEGYALLDARQEDADLLVYNDDALHAKNALSWLMKSRPPTAVTRFGVSAAPEEYMNQMWDEMVAQQSDMFEGLAVYCETARHNSRASGARGFLK